MDPKKVSRGLFTLNALVAGVGGFLADWNATHLFNPRWPPHARYHDAQALSVGARWAWPRCFLPGGAPATRLPTG